VGRKGGRPGSGGKSEKKKLYGFVRNDLEGGKKINLLGSPKRKTGGIGPSWVRFRRKNFKGPKEEGEEEEERSCPNAESSKPDHKETGGSETTEAP